MVGFTIGEYGLIEFGPELLDDEEETGKLEGCAIDETVSEDQGEVVGLNTLVVIAEAVADDGRYCHDTFASRYKGSRGSGGCY